MMQEPIEPASYAEGQIAGDLAECRQPSRWPVWGVTSVISLAFGVLAWGHQLPYLPKNRTGWKIESVLLVCILVWRLFYNARYRVIADASGLRWRGMWGEKSVSWDQVTNYYLKWSLKFIPPLGEGGGGALYSHHRMRYLRMPRPEHLMAVIETTRGPVKLHHLLTGRESVCAWVRAQATAAPGSRWEAQEYQVHGGSRTFVYEIPKRRTVALRILTNPVCLILPLLLDYGFLFVMILTHFDRYAMGWYLLLSALLWLVGYVASAGILLRWRRECQNRRDERLMVTPTQFIRETAGSRVAMNFEDIIELRQEREPWIFGRNMPWLVRTATTEIPFFVRGLKDGNGLPAIIYSRSPGLWLKLEPIASPIPTSDHPLGEI